MYINRKTLLTPFLAACFSVTLFVQPLLFGQTTEPGEVSPPICNCEATDRLARYSVEESIYEIPELSLQRADGATVTARSELDYDGPVLLQFAFTSCATLCPVLGSTTAQVQNELGDAASRLRIVTITIDPAHDTVLVLKEYAESLGAGEQWHFLTGTPENVAAVQKALDAYTPNKSRHEALTFLREGNGKPWRRITGLISANDLLMEVRAMISTADAGTNLGGKSEFAGADDSRGAGDSR